MSASASFSNAFAFCTSRTTSRISTLISRAPAAAGDLSTESINLPAKALLRRSRSLRKSVICVFLISRSVAGRPRGCATPAASKKRDMHSRWYAMNSTSHASPPAIGPQRLASAAVAKHRHWVTSVTRLLNPSKNCLTLWLNIKLPTGLAPSCPGLKTRGPSGDGGFDSRRAPLSSLSSSRDGFGSSARADSTASTALSTSRSSASLRGVGVEVSRLSFAFEAAPLFLFIAASSSPSSIGTIFCFPVILSRSTRNARIVCFVRLAALRNLNSRYRYTRTTATYFDGSSASNGSTPASTARSRIHAPKKPNTTARSSISSVRRAVAATIASWYAGMLLHGLDSASSLWYFDSALWIFSILPSGTSPLSIASSFASETSHRGTITSASRNNTGAANNKPCVVDTRSG